MAAVLLLPVLVLAGANARQRSTRYCIALHWLRYTALIYTAPFALRLPVLRYTSLHLTVLRYTLLHYSAPHFTILRYTTLHCITRLCIS